MLAITPSPTAGATGYSSTSPAARRGKVKSIMKKSSRVGKSAEDQQLPQQAQQPQQQQPQAWRPSPSPAVVARAPSTAARKEKVNAVSKASLAMLDPRHAMGMECYDSPQLWESSSADEYAADGLSISPSSSLPGADDASSNNKSGLGLGVSSASAYSRSVSAPQAARWKASSSPTPELEAFTTSESYSTPKVASSTDSPSLEEFEYALGDEDTLGSALDVPSQQQQQQRSVSFDLDSSERSVWEEDRSGGENMRGTSSSDTARTARPSDYVGVDPIAAAAAVQAARKKKETLSRIFTWKKSSSSGSAKASKQAPPHPLSKTAFASFSHSTSDLTLSSSASLPMSAPPTCTTFEERYGALGFSQPLQSSESFAHSFYEHSRSQPCSPVRAFTDLPSIASSMSNGPPIADQAPRRPSVPDAYKVNGSTTPSNSGKISLPSLPSLRDLRSQARRKKSSPPPSDGFIARSGSGDLPASQIFAPTLSESPTNESFDLPRSFSAASAGFDSELPSCATARPVSRIVSTVGRGVPGRASSRTQGNGGSTRTRIQSVYIPEDAGSPSPSLVNLASWGQSHPAPPLPALPAGFASDRATRRRSRSVGSILPSGLIAGESTPTQRDIAAFRAESGRSNSFSGAEVQTVQARRVNLKQKSAKAVAVPSPSLSSRSPRGHGKSPKASRPHLVVTVMPPTPDVGSETPVADSGAFEGTAPCVRQESNVAQRPEIVSSRQREHSQTAEVASIPQQIAQTWAAPEQVKPFEVAELDFSQAKDGAVRVVNSAESRWLQWKAAQGEERSRRGSNASDDTSAPFGFSRSMSNGSLRSEASSGGETFSAAGSPVKSFASLSTVTGHESSASGGSLSRSPSSNSLASDITTSTSILDYGSDEGRSFQNHVAAQEKKQPLGLRTPFEFNPSNQEDDCDTPKISPPSKLVSEGVSESGGPQLELRFSDGLGLGLGLNQTLEDVPALSFSIPVTPALCINKSEGKKASPTKAMQTPPPVLPPKSRARLAVAAARKTSPEKPTSPQRSPQRSMSTENFASRSTISPKAFEDDLFSPQRADQGLGLGLTADAQEVGEGEVNPHDAYDSPHEPWSAMPRSESTDWSMGVAM